MKFLSLFAGIGGLDLGCEIAGWQSVYQCEIDPFCRAVLAKHWPNVPRHDDVRTLTGDMVRDAVGAVDAIVGGFPCQDVSNAGKRAGIDGARSGLWAEYFRLVCEIRPRIVFVENVTGLLVRGLGRVLGDMASVGYDAEWTVLSACRFGAPHSRERMFLTAYSGEIGRLAWPNQMSLPTGCNQWKATEGKREWKDLERWIVETFHDCYGAADAPALQRVDDGLTDRLDRLAACGNAVVPQCAAVIARAITESQ